MCSYFPFDPPSLPLFFVSYRVVHIELLLIARLLHALVRGQNVLLALLQQDAPFLEGARPNFGALDVQENGWNKKVERKEIFWLKNQQIIYTFSDPLSTIHPSGLFCFQSFLPPSLPPYLAS